MSGNGMLFPLGSLHTYTSRAMYEWYDGYEGYECTCHTLARPDLYFLWPGRLVIVIEFDENNHTDCTTKSEMQHLHW
jgi:hypothetical protein